MARRRRQNRLQGIQVILGALALSPGTLVAADGTTSGTVSSQYSEENSEQSERTIAGYPFPPTNTRTLAPGSDVTTRGRLRKETKPKTGGLIEVPAWAAAQFDWYKFKKDVTEKTGVTFGGAYAALAQTYSDSLVGEKAAYGSRLKINFSTDLIGRGTENVGSLNMSVEDRRAIVNDISLQQAGIAAGSVLPTAAVWSDFGFGITQLYWSQRLFDNQVAFDVGRLFAPAYIDAYPLFDDSRQFLNISFSTNPTVVTPVRGAGAVVNAFVTEDFYARAGIYNANSEDTSSTLGNLFSEFETFQHLEIGWTGDVTRRLGLSAQGVSDMDNIHLMVWHKDNQEDRGIDESAGVTFSANVLLTESFMPFLRAGWSDGEASLVDGIVSTGFGLRPFGRQGDLFSVGASWASPSNDALRDQYTFEAFYRLELIDNVTITPDIQVVVNPSLDPDDDMLIVGGLRMRTTF